MKTDPARRGRSLERFAAKLFPDPAEAERFVESFGSESMSAVLWTKERPEYGASFFQASASYEPLPLPAFVEPVPPGVRPGAHPLHDEGYFYSLDASSALAATVLTGIPSGFQGRVLDLCSAPGGKGIFAWRLLSPELIVCNDSSHGRLKALISNLQRCGIHPAWVTGYDSGDLARLAPGSFDLVIVDAPCSGQSLLRKGKPVPGCFHKAIIHGNAKRQRRIAANAAALTCEYLAYMTCTFSRDENEGVIEWLTGKFPELEHVSVPALEPYRSKLSELPCYRFWPWDGAGGFAALLRKTEGKRVRSIESTESLKAFNTFWRSKPEFTIPES